MTRIDLSTDNLRREMEGLNRLADSFGQKLVTSLASAVTQGRSLSDIFRSLALSTASQALSSALRPLGNLVGDALDSALTPAARQAPPGLRAASAVTVNISTPDAASFRQSQGQVSAMIARAVAQGQRNL